jgi:hypothetical protein
MDASRAVCGGVRAENSEISKSALPSWTTTRGGCEATQAVGRKRRRRTYHSGFMMGEMTGCSSTVEEC